MPLPPFPTKAIFMFTKSSGSIAVRGTGGGPGVKKTTRSWGTAPGCVGSYS
ncbi:hypothetical protein SLI_3802 [Streptomyces lividans 1326]|uniref:Uncharacterized protein n=1 Tax=Streptomyces lividans 1326 TaxID=1200984 RepID=A0A7U9DU72_STRLI|nr:hypothetical protein SLI_3802 [Streptomyces lividans 1326]